MDNQLLSRTEPRFLRLVANNETGLTIRRRCAGDTSKLGVMLTAQLQSRVGPTISDQALADSDLQNDDLTGVLTAVALHIRRLETALAAALAQRDAERAALAAVCGALEGALAAR